MADVAPAVRRRRGLRVLGHPVHAALSAFPLAFLSVALPIDAIAWISGSAFWWQVSFWVVVAGLVSAVPTVAAGLVDYATLLDEEGAMRAGTTHLLLMLSVVTCFGLDLVLRGGSGVPHGLALASTFLLDAAGTALVTVGGWYGGELVFGHGVGRGR